MFLLDYEKHGIVAQAAKHAKVSRETHYVWMETDPDYRAASERAKQDSIDAIEAEIRKRATRRKSPSDTLLIFLAKKLNPEFRDNYKVELGNAGGVPLSLDVHFVNPPTDATGEG